MNTDNAYVKFIDEIISRRLGDAGSYERRADEAWDNDDHDEWYRCSDAYMDLKYHIIGDTIRESEREWEGSREEKGVGLLIIKSMVAPPIRNRFLRFLSEFFMNESEILAAYIHRKCEDAGLWKRRN